VTGSTALGEELDAEDMRALMGRYYEHARRVVESHGGTLEKFIGDAVMAVFGLPHAHGDDAERAVAAALALQNAVREDSMLGERVMLRMGVNTGEVIATSDPSSGDFLVTGDAVNVSARLQQSANPGEILASERTCAATGASFLFGEKQQAEVKGKSEPLRVFPVAGARPVRRVERPSLVGRQRELAQLSLLESWALEERRPQLLSIIAPAGTGKTAARARAEYVGVVRAIRFAEIPHALAARNAAGLAQAIDEAERHGLVPHAARMRIVLAEMTRDPAPLEQARPVLERLEDRQYNRRLEEVAASLG
jgi:class 3 adenylate cyclase